MRPSSGIVEELTARGLKKAVRNGADLLCSHRADRGRLGDREVAMFKELDEQFHGELEKLVAIAISKDGAATGSQVGVVLSKCSDCHAQFKP